MPKMFVRTLAVVAAVVGAQCIAGYQAFAAEEPKTPQQEEIDRLKAEAERYKEEANLIAQRAERDKARIKALGLPEYAGTTTLSGSNPGVMEATMLAMHALQEAADKIGAAIPKDESVVVLTSTETVDLNQATMIETQLDATEQQLIAALGEDRRSGVRMSLSPTTVIAAVGAVANLFRSETTVTATDLAAVSERALANAVASRLKERAYLPSALVGPLDTTGGLLARLEEVGLLRQRAAQMLAAQPANGPKAVVLTAAIKRFDDLSLKVTSPNSEGVVPIVRAAQLSQLFLSAPSVLRVYVDRAGGTFVNTKNINTFFGADPLRVTGGLVASYALSEPNTGKVKDSNIFVCRTTLSRLRQIHDASWKGPGGVGRAKCTPMAVANAPVGAPAGGN